MNARVSDDWPLTHAYHQTRERLYRRMVAEAVRTPRVGALILDAGCGDAFYSRLLTDRSEERRVGKECRL